MTMTITLKPETAAPASFSWHDKAIDETRSTLRTDPARGPDRRRGGAATASRYGFNELQETPGLRRSCSLVLGQLDNFLIMILIVAARRVVPAGRLHRGRGDHGDRRPERGPRRDPGVEGGRGAGGAEEDDRAGGPRDPRRRADHASMPARSCRATCCFWRPATTCPADVRLVESVNLRIEEASLTGESVPVEKTRQCGADNRGAARRTPQLAFMGTLVTYGRGKAIATSTGMRTEIGQIAEMIQSFEDEDTPLQRKLDQLGTLAGHRLPDHLRRRRPGRHRARHAPRPDRHGRPGRSTWPSPSRRSCTCS